MYLFLTGGAGVGKTVVLKAIYQAMIKYYNRAPDSNPDDTKILLGTPTGVVAYLMKGNTALSLQDASYPRICVESTHQRHYNLIASIKMLSFTTYLWIPTGCCHL